MSAFDKKQHDPLFMALSSKSKELADSVRQARETFGCFQRAFQQGTYPKAYHLVKAAFVDQSDGKTVAHLWLGVREIGEDSILCFTCNVPKGFKGLRDDQRVTLAYDDVEDWMINSEGKLYGGFSIRLQRKFIPVAERASFDRYAGIVEYAEELP